MTTRFAAAALLVLAAALRLLAIGEQELWLDETLSWRKVTAPGFLATLRAGNTPPLYYALLRQWIALAGDSPTALRLLSALEGAFYVAAVMWWARIMFTCRVALWTGLWAAVAPMAIYYSQETRAYAQLSLLLALTYGCLCKALTDSRAAWWFGAVIAGTATLYTHYLAPLALLCCAALVAAAPKPSPWRRAGAAAAASTLLFTPWVLAAVSARPAASGLDWIAAIWERTSTLAILQSLQVLTLGGDAASLPVRFKQLSAIDVPPALQVAGIAGLVLFAVVVVRPFGDADAGPNATRWKWAVLLLACGPLLLLWSVSWLQPVFLVGRYDQIAMPACAVFLGLACAKVQARRGTAPALSLALLLLVPIGWRLWLYYRAAPDDRARRTAALLDERTRDGDVVVFTELRAWPVIYQLTRRGYVFDDKCCTDAARGRQFSCRSYPRESEEIIGAILAKDPTSDAAAIAADAADFADDRARASNSVWIALGDYRAGRGTLAAKPMTAALLRRFEELGLAPSAADSAAGILEYRSVGRGRP